MKTNKKSLENLLLNSIYIVVVKKTIYFSTSYIKKFKKQGTSHNMNYYELCYAVPTFNIIPCPHAIEIRLRTR